MAIDLLKTVSDRNGNVREIKSVGLAPLEGGDPIIVSYENFIDAYDEFVDPKDLEIVRLTEQVKKLKEQLEGKTLRKKRRKHLSKGEIKDIQELIRAGHKNIAIAKDFDISDPSISKIRTEMRKRGEDV